MKILRESSEAEMILEYLKAGYSSKRFAKELLDSMKMLSVDEKIIVAGDLKSGAENGMRRELLGLYRGYGAGRKMFERFPEVLDWKLCGFSGEDLDAVRYIKYSYWDELSGGTHLPATAAETVRKGIRIFDQSNDGFVKAAEYLKAGGGFPKMFFLTDDGAHFVIVEGHLRMTAYAMAPECFQDVEVIVGFCKKNAIDQWM